MAKYRYFVAFVVRDEDGDFQHGFTETVRSAPICGHEDVMSIAEDIADGLGVAANKVGVTNFRLFAEAPAALPEPLVARMVALLRRYAVAGSGPPCTCEVCTEARALIAEAEARVVGGEASE
jgi:hypothetical protein